MSNWFSRYRIRQKYRNDQQGIMQRYLRESGQWEAHLKHTQEFILSCLANDSYRSIAVLGSGWLLDVPVEALLGKTRELHLFDAVHPRQIIHKYKENKNMVFITRDLSSGLIQQAALCKSTGEFMSAIEKLKPEPIFYEYDWVVSVNLLNQLDNLLIEFLHARFSLTDEQEERIRKQVQDHHINSLPKEKSCLISDWIEVSEDLSEKTLTEKPLIYGCVPNAENYQSWNWVFDTHQKYRTNVITTFKVRAYKF